MRRCINRLFYFSCTICILMTVLLVLPLQVHAQVISGDQATSYSILGPPTVSASFIDQVLAANNSPATGNGQAIYNDGVKYGIDPVFALAFFMHESSFGTAGIAQLTLSPGNLRCIPSADCLSGYAAFPSWSAGFDAWYQLIRSLYVDTWGLTTVDQVIPRYAPPSDNNDDSAYISTVENAIDAWRSNQIATLGPPPQVNNEPATTSDTPQEGPSPSISYSADGYNIVGKPTIDAAFIDKILTRYHSPAAGKGKALYDAGLKAHIDPIYALAFFMHDSIFGTVGMARVTHSVGNLPAPGSANCSCKDFHGYRQYDSWEAGFSDWYEFIQQRYISLNVTTIGQIVPDYSVSKDPTIIKSFIRTIESRIDVWRNQYTHTTQEGGTSLSLSSLLG
ncbi:MAG: glucosaminidase domain-containing protein [Ktedonobacteraceae bacterium]|nr:glucosaminidase domain-containing protein [Ktedonobacteraceae bacterium]